MLTGEVPGRAEFNGLVNQERCDSYLAELEADGKQDIAERLDCSALYFAEGGDLKLWSISVYYVVVTLTTCAPLAHTLPSTVPVRSLIAFIEALLSAWVCAYACACEPVLPPSVPPTRSAAAHVSRGITAESRSGQAIAPCRDQARPCGADACRQHSGFVC